MVEPRALLGRVPVAGGQELANVGIGPCQRVVTRIVEDKVGGIESRDAFVITGHDQIHLPASELRVWVHLKSVCQCRSSAYARSGMPLCVGVDARSHLASRDVLR